MSGFQNVTGFAAPTSLSGVMSTLQKAFWRGVPFSVVASQVKKGRKVAIHDYPFRDGGWAEDMGRALRTYSFSGYLIGDIAPAMQLALDAAIEAPGPGLLIHPTLGAQMVSLLSASTAVRKDAGRVIEVSFEFIEQGAQSLITTLIATAVNVLAAADIAVAAIGSDYATAVVAVSPIGGAPPAPVTAEASAVIGSFGEACQAGGDDPAAVVSLAAGLSPPDANSTYGRYGAGRTSAATPAVPSGRSGATSAAGNTIPVGATVQTLQASVTTNRAAIANATTTAKGSAATLSAATAPAIAINIAAIIEAMRTSMTDPADQVRVLLGLSTFNYTSI